MTVFDVGVSGRRRGVGVGGNGNFKAIAGLL